MLDLGRGKPDAAAKLTPLVYDELHALANWFMRKERAGHTLQPTALINEVYLRLVDQTKVNSSNRTQFVALAAEMMRRILVDHARKRAAAKRGGNRKRLRLTGHDMAADQSDAEFDLLAIDEALHELKKLDERQARVVELRFFGGLSIDETAVALGVSDRTVKEDWRAAKAWLGKELLGDL